jgi:hypothetical protein
MKAFGVLLEKISIDALIAVFALFGLSITPLFNSSKTSWAHVTLIGCSPSPAYYLKLQFTRGDVSSLLYVCCDKDFKKGSIKTIVSETAGEGERPIRVTWLQ